MQRINITPQFLTTKVLASRWQVSPRTLEGWRDKGIGLSFIKIGNRIRYRLCDIERAEAEWSKEMWSDR
ncbi:helix-turn-helix domain-containing protein [Alteriqipengyuania sp. WL0013]|uniref:helix-turn-helix domain-containing protein n=1 Tax=Alteriqipengyuania sp. WL0013 TaxID=3110773 RepID=UPI003A5D168F